LGTLTITSCKSKKSVQKGSTEVTVPLAGKEYQSDKEYFRASQSGKSPDLATAKKIALQNAKTELAGNIQSTIKAVTDNYTNQRSVGDKQAYENKFEEMARSVVNQTLNDVKIIGEKTFKEKDNKFTYYVAIEMSKEPIIKDLADRISKDQQLQLDFDKKQFLKVFDEEMDKFDAEK
jgi:hypothetical protein